MTDEYICKDCGHRAGDHAVNNRCLNCDCVADPYLEQLVALRKQLDIAVKLLKNLKPILDKLGYGIGDTLTEIEKVGKDE